MDADKAVGQSHFHVQQRPREPRELRRCTLQLIVDGLSMSFGAVKALPDQSANTKE